jgi:hypothetical protein
LGVLLVAVIGKLVQNWERDSYIHKKKQYTKPLKKHGIHKIESKTYIKNKNTKNIKMQVQ